MKKMFLVLSLICFVVSMICSWFTGGFLYGLILTVIFGGLTVLSGYLLRKHSSVRPWIVVVLTVFALNALAYSSAAVTMHYLQSTEDISIDSATEDEVVEQSDVISDENDETESIEAVEEDEEVVEQDKDSEDSTASEKESNQQVVTKVVEKVIEKEVPVEKIVEKEVPVEKVVTEYVEVPVVEYVEVEAPKIEDPDPVPAPALNTTPVYTGDPTGMNAMYYGGYTGDPTVANYGYGYNYGYTGDPTGGNGYSYGTVSISGSKSVTQGETYKYTISGVSSISKNKLDLPANVSVEKISGNTVYLYFEDGWTGSYSIGYGNATITVKVKA